MPDPIPQEATEKVVFEFQHTDENGQPIIDPRTGRQAYTNLTGENFQEIAEKMRDAYLNVARAFNRSRSHRPVPKEPEPQPKQLSPEEERQATADLQDPAKARSAIRKLNGTEELEKEIKKAREAKDNADALAAQHKFMLNHLNDFFPCTANSQIIWKYINEKGLDPRAAENFEIAFNEVQGQLAQKAAHPPAAEPQPAPRRANGGIQPGQMNGQRPQARSPQQSNEDFRKEIQKMPRDEYKRRMKDPKFVDRVNAAFSQT